MPGGEAGLPEGLPNCGGWGTLAGGCGTSESPLTSSSPLSTATRPAQGSAAHPEAGRLPEGPPESEGAAGKPPSAGRGRPRIPLPRDSPSPEERPWHQWPARASHILCTQCLPVVPLGRPRSVPPRLESHVLSCLTPLEGKRSRAGGREESPIVSQPSRAVGTQLTASVRERTPPAPRPGD